MAQRASSLIPKITDPNPQIQRTSPLISSKEPLRKKIKTPGRWDAVTNKIAIRKKEEETKPPKCITSKVNTNLPSNRITATELHTSSNRKGTTRNTPAESLSSQSSPCASSDHLSEKPTATKWNSFKTPTSTLLKGV